jgi:hypothetical protein
MSDLSDLEGVFGSSIRWNSEGGELSADVLNKVLEREPHLIELGSQSATFVADMSTRERGYGMVAVGVFDFVMTPVGSPPPERPSPEHKPALGFYLWNPVIGEVKMITCSAYLRMTIDAFWDRYRTFKEASQGLLPVICFADRREIRDKKYGSVYYMPVIHIIGWVKRSQVPCFAQREPTVPMPVALDAQIAFQALPAAPSPNGSDLQQRTQEKLSSKPTPATDADILKAAGKTAEGSPGRGGTVSGAKHARSEVHYPPGHPTREKPAVEPKKPLEKGSLDDMLNDGLPEDL